MHESQDRPKRKPRENLREVLIAGFDPTVEANRGKPLKRPNAMEVASSLIFGGGASFFVGVFAGVAFGALLGFAGLYAFDRARGAMHSTLPWLVSGSQMQPIVYVAFTLFGVAFGIYAGSAWLAPWLETRRTRQRRRYG